jgi:hypothetical protein
MEVIQAKANSLIPKFIFLLLKRTLIMKKGKMIISAMAFVIAIGTAFAFKAKTAGPGDLWYINSDFSCVQAPCSKVDQGPANPCSVGQLYTADGCNEQYNETAWVTDGGNK